MKKFITNKFNLFHLGGMKVTKETLTEFINEMIIEPRIKALKWSCITNQTAHLKVGYSGQHLASLVTGVEGEGSGARGNDLSDGSEVKTCSRVDQLDSCRDCKTPVFRSSKKCISCGSTKIKRNNDSKWLFTIRSKEDLQTLVNNKNLDRIILILDDYPGFDDENFDNIRIQVFEIYPKESRHRNFKQIMTNYYNSIYLEHKKNDPAKTPAPKNFWPYQYQFYLSNPILVFNATIYNAASENANLVIHDWIEPKMDRKSVESVIMPPSILKLDEFSTILKNAPREIVEQNLKQGTTYEQFEETVKKGKNPVKLFKGITEKLREYLTLRDTDKITTAKERYSRRKKIATV